MLCRKASASRFADFWKECWRARSRRILAFLEAESWENRTSRQMKLSKREWMALAAGLLFGTGAALYLYQRSNPPSLLARGDLLDLMPVDSSAIFFADLAQLRSAPFLE